jgi:hypothetical protein
VFDLFNAIEQPNEVILTLTLNACAQIGTKEMLHRVQQIISNLSEAQQLNRYLITSIIDALMKCGDVAASESFFNRSKVKPLQAIGAMMNGRLVSVSVVRIT